MTGYDTCTACFVGRHDACDGEASIYHVGSYHPETVDCVCPTCASERGPSWAVWWDQR